MRNLKLRTPLFALILFIIGCSSTPVNTNSIVIRIKNDPLTLDPAYIVDVTSGQIAAQIFSPLIRFSKGMELVPDIASNWSTPDGKNYIFYIKRNIRFSDGTPLTAYSIKRSFERILTINPPSPRKWIFSNIEKIRVVDKFTLRIELKSPSETFLAKLTMPNAFITPDGKTGTGAYKIKEWEKDQYILLEKNPYTVEPVATEDIKFRVIPEDVTAKVEFSQGKIDIMEINPVDTEGFSRKGRGHISTTDALNTYYIGFNLRNPYLQDRNLRRALNYAIDRQTIIYNVLKGQATPAYSPVPPILLKSSHTALYRFLPKKARFLLKRCKIRPEQPLVFGIRSSALSIQIAEIVQSYLLKIGIQTKIQILEWSAFKEAINSGKLDLFLMSWWADYPDAENFIYPTFYSKNKGPLGNRTFYSNPAVDRLIERSRTVTGKERQILLDKLNRIISLDAPWIFLWHTKQVYAINSSISNFYPHPVYSCIKYNTIKKSGKRRR